MLPKRYPLYTTFKHLPLNSLFIMPPDTVTIFIKITSNTANVYYPKEDQKIDIPIWSCDRVHRCYDPNHKET